MLKFVEVVEKPLEYDVETESCKSSSSLREIYINPDYIVSMKENEVLKQKSAHEPLVEGMNKSLSFTELTMHIRPNGSGVLNVIGSPSEIIKKYHRG